MTEIVQLFGGIDILINNAGISIPTLINDENYEEKQNNGFSNNFFYSTPKEYKASTLDWLAGQARI